MSCQAVTLASMIAMTIAGCLAVATLIAGIAVEIVTDIRAYRSRDASKSTSSVGCCRACARGVRGALRSADEGPSADRGDTR